MKIPSTVINLLARGTHGQSLEESFPSLQSFFPPGRELDLKLTTTTVAYHEVTPATAAALKQMPSMITSYRHDKLLSTYILPPIV